MMLEPTLSVVTLAISGARALDDVAGIWRLDRRCSFDKHHEASLYCQSRLQQAGLETEIVPVPADGETLYGDWIMPRAWDVRSATLRLLAAEGRPERTLCDYSEEPCSLIIYSAPTPPGGVAAELVALDGGTKPEDYDGLDVAGKIILTPRPGAVKEQAVKHGAAGLVTDWMAEYEGCRPHMELPDTRSWVRSGSDYSYGGCGVKKGDTECWGFVLSPRQGRWLRQLLRAEDGLWLHAEVGARFYDGTLDLVMGRVPGRTREEVLINGHLSEVGAIDNASGCALAMEVLRTLNGLIASRRLPRPRRGIRMLFTYECMGTMAAVVERKDVFRNLVAGVTVDCVGGREHSCRAPLDLCRNPHPQSSYTDTLLRLILERLTETEPLLVNWRDRPYSDADNLISDPTIGVPCPLLMECPYTFYHTSSDTPDKLDPEKLGWIGAAVATYVYFIANAGAPEARWLAEQVLSEGQKAIIDLAAEHICGQPSGDATLSGATLRARFDYLATRYTMALRSTARLVSRKEREGFLRGLRPLEKVLGASAGDALARTARACGIRFPARSRGRRDEAARLVPTRLVLGQSRMTRIPREDREQWAAMCERGNASKAAFDALLWADGSRTIAEIEELVKAGRRIDRLQLVGYFRALESYGYVRLRQRRAGRRN